MNLFYINGKFIDEKNAKISVYDLGLLRGYAVFDFLRTYNQKPFYLKEHLKRLLNSAQLIGLKHNFNLNFLEKIVLKTLDKNIKITKNKNQEFNIRIILTGGETKDFISPSRANLIILITPLKEYPKRLYKKGGKLITKISERIIPRAKTIVYTEAVKFLQIAKKKGAIEVLLLDKNKKILECTTSNFFAVINKKLYTPKLEKILPGITRKIVIQLARKLKIKVIEKDLDYKDIKKFDEAFITASNKEILPIIKIDKIKINNGEVGEITKKLIAEFNKLKNDQNN